MPDFPKMIKKLIEIYAEQEKVKINFELEEVK